MSEIRPPANTGYCYNKYIYITQKATTIIRGIPDDIGLTEQCTYRKINGVSKINDDTFVLKHDEGELELQVPNAKEFRMHGNPYAVYIITPTTIEKYAIQYDDGLSFIVNLKKSSGKHTKPARHLLD
jgi:hypothetical protein